MAAATLAELEAEILILKDLEERALRLKLSGRDAKWRELESILDEPMILDAATGLRRKIIIFTEPRDTLDYLAQREPAARRAFDGQLRSALEPEPDRAAVRAHSPDRPDRGLPPLEPLRHQHTRGRGLSSPTRQAGRSARGTRRQSL